MGKRPTNATKGGKFMNPTDQARYLFLYETFIRNDEESTRYLIYINIRKEARRRELKKNKKQRMLVRTAVLKGNEVLQKSSTKNIISVLKSRTNSFRSL
jgi:WW domain-binding protein 11